MNSVTANRCKQIPVCGVGGRNMILDGISYESLLPTSVASNKFIDTLIK